MRYERSPGMAQSLLLLLGSCLPVLGAVLLAPVLPRMQEHFAETPGATVLVPIALTLPALVISIMAPFAGVIADRVGRKPLLLWAMLFYSLCGLLPLWLESLPAIVLSRAGIGLAEAAIMTGCTTLMGDYYSGARRERLFAMQMVATSLSAAVFIAAGGLLGESGWRTPFVLYGVGFLFLPFMAKLLWEPSAERVQDTESELVTAFPWERIAPLYLLSVLAGISLFIVPVQAGFLLNLLHVTAPQQIGITMGANQLGVVAGALSFRLLGTLPASKQLLLAFMVAGAGGLMMAVASRHDLLVVAVLINGLGVGLMLPALITRIMSYVSFEHRGRAAGGFTAALFAGEFISPLVVLAMTGGVIASLPLALAVVAVVQFLVGLLFVGVRHSVKGEKAFR